MSSDHALSSTLDTADPLWIIKTNVMKQIKWFEREFDFPFQQNIFPSIIERLDGTFIRLKTKIERIPPELLEIKPGEKWSIKENIGHLIDLEPLRQGRLDDILANKEYLRSTDLENKMTDIALHIKTDINNLLKCRNEYIWKKRNKSLDRQLIANASNSSYIRSIICNEKFTSINMMLGQISNGILLTYYHLLEMLEICRAICLAKWRHLVLN